MFKYIGKYRPPTVDLPTRLKPFIPEFIPATGGTDEFIKVPRPDGRPDYLGLKVLDEPAAVQSDPTLLNLQLKQLSKDTPGTRLEVVGCIEHGDKDRRQRLATWISSIADLHKSKPAAAVHYSRPMPDLEVLMQEWPPELEAALRSSKLPTADLVRRSVYGRPVTRKSVTAWFHHRHVTRSSHSINAIGPAPHRSGRKWGHCSVMSAIFTHIRDGMVWMMCWTQAGV
eukprot:GHRQ01013071.1.p1 GENE.GHRQ01013071.1~~GHRQ01013071.1.p1  ORF type:complete len:227 (+),score=73.24 GHRQ01013071.1:1075-1755(+)